MNVCIIHFMVLFCRYLSMFIPSIPCHILHKKTFAFKTDLF